MKKWISLLCSAAMLMVLLAGCGGGNEASGSGDNGGEKVSISIWHNWTGQDAKAVAMRKIIEDFRAQHPEIEVIDEGLPTDGLKTRLRTVAAADEMPDLFVMWPDAMTKEFVKGDLLQPINDELDANPDWTGPIDKRRLLQLTRYTRQVGRQHEHGCRQRKGGIRQNQRPIR